MAQQHHMRKCELDKAIAIVRGYDVSVKKH